MSRKIKTPCRGRKITKCKSAKKSCKMTKGTRRTKYCRKTHNNSTRNKK